jgi:hypothetical protein
MGVWMVWIRNRGGGIKGEDGISAHERRLGMRSNMTPIRTMIAAVMIARVSRTMIAAVMIVRVSRSQLCQYG